MTVTTGFWIPIIEASDFKLAVTWSGSGKVQELRTWTLAELASLKRASSRERDPFTDKVVGWSGVFISDLIENALATVLSAEQGAQVDLVVLESQNGKKALIPRAFIVKYPMLLASVRDKRNLAETGPLCSVVPWTSRPKLLSEELPVENYFLPQIKRVELTNYNEQFSVWFLKRRTDPSAIRGERLFLQTCVGCHGGGYGPSVLDMTSKFLNSYAIHNEHVLVKGVPKMSDQDKRSLMHYLRAYTSENQPNRKGM